MDNVIDTYKVLDKRPKNKFIKHTFGGYKKNQVWSQWTKSLNNNIIDKSIYWTVELDISGLQDSIWTKMIRYFSNNINIQNPRIVFYIWKRYNYYLEFKKRCTDIMLMRNNQALRNHLCEVICVLTLSVKNKLPTLDKISKTEFSASHLKKKQKHQSYVAVRELMKIDDPREFIIPINELHYGLSRRDNSFDNRQTCLYWLSWLYEYTKVHDKINPKICNCVPRLVVGVPDKYTNDVFWIVWDVIFDCIKKNTELYRQVTCLFYFYKQGYTNTKKSSRKCYIIHAILLCVDTVPNIKYDTDIFVSYPTTVTYTMRINTIYNKLATPRKVNTIYSEPIKEKKKPPDVPMLRSGELK